MKKMHILLIDDDIDELTLFTMAFENLPDHFRCTYLNSAHEAFKWVQNIAPDCIFLNINMPICDGWECLHKLQKAEKTAYVPIILYSTTIDDLARRKAEAMGIYKCLQKPVLPSMLKKVLKDILNDFYLTQLMRGGERLY